MQQLTPQQLKKLEKLAKVLDGGDVALLQEIEEVQTDLSNRVDSLAAQIPDIESVIERVKDGKDGATGERGERGEQGAKGDPGERGADGKDGLTGAPGRDGIDGRDGVDGQDGKNGADGFVDVATVAYLEDRIETVEKKIEDAPFKQVGGLGLGAVQRIASDVMNSFESVSKNIKSSNAISSTETSITYENGITKTIDSSDPTTIVITLSGATPDGIDLVKTITFTGNNLPTHTYS